MASTVATIAKRGEILKSLRQRTIAVSVSPTPTSFAERRSILQVLEQYGQVDFFKAIPGRNPTFISIMRDEDSLRQLTSLSPLRYVVKTKPSAIVQPSVTELPEPPQTSQGDGTVEKEFILNATHDPRFSHKMIGSKLDLQRSWPEFYDQDNSFTVQTLKQSLPDTPAAKGLAHWNVDLGKKKTKAPEDAAKIERIDLLRWVPTKMKKHQPKRKATAERNDEASPKPTQNTAVKE